MMSNYERDLLKSLKRIASNLDSIDKTLKSMSNEINKEEPKSCKTCAYDDTLIHDQPCTECNSSFDKWVKKED